MSKVDNSGYILVDFSKVDHNKRSQVIDGFYADCEKLISNEKFVLLSNVNEVSTTPIPSIVLFKNSIYNVITFEYVYTISAGDVVVVTKNEGGITVDVIDDSIIALNKTWSSSKINEMLPDNAGQIIYDNSVSHLQSNRVQSAIDELVTIVNGVDSRVVVTETDISNIKNQLITIANELSLLHDAANIEVFSGVSVTDVLTSLDQNKQDILTAGNNITISSNSVISAVDTTYTAGNNVNISVDNVISAIDTVYGAGDGIDITNNVIAVDPVTANITAANVEYSTGISVADKLDSLKIIKTGKANYSDLKGGGFADRVLVPVTFDSPMPNSAYVAFAMVNDAYNDFPFIRIYPFQKTATGFTAVCINQSGTQVGVGGSFDWLVIS